MNLKKGLPQKVELLREIGTIDSDRDRYPEIIIKIPGEYPGPNGSLKLYELSPTGFIVNKRIVPSGYLYYMYEHELVVTDLHGDGIQDILCGEYWFSGTSNGSFLENTTIIAGGQSP